MKKWVSQIKAYLNPLKLLFESDLERAIRREEFVFFYQPEIDLKTGKTVGVEALLRWKHPHKGMISPASFIPVLERTKLINKLSPFLFAQSMKDLRRLHDIGFKNLFMSVNLSVVQLEDKKLVQLIKRNLQKFKIPPKFYECEVTESSMIENLPTELAVLSQINHLKIRLSIDDFGTGYASFNYLRQLSVQKLKIDQEFVASAFDHKNNEILLSSMIELGRKLKLTVLAEGIETQKQLDFLKKNNCEMGQGFYFSRPLPFDELVLFLKNEKQK